MDLNPRNPWLLLAKLQNGGYIRNGCIEIVQSGLQRCLINGLTRHPGPGIVLAEAG
jgi:hypothetical protein